MANYAIILHRMGCWEDLLALTRQFTEWHRQERSLFGDAVKNYIGQKRHNIRLLEKIRSHKRKSTEPKAYIAIQLIEEQIAAIRVEIDEAAQKALSILDAQVPQNTSESQCWLNKMKGDIYRYQSEMDPAAAERAKHHYESAREQFTSLPNDCAGLRCSVLCNYACFYAEIEHNTSQAQKLLDEGLRMFPDGVREFEMPIGVMAMAHNKAVWA